MIYGIGTDLVEVERMERLWRRFGWRFASKLLMPAEQDELRERRDPARLLAKRFAAKEAFAKALGTGLRAPVLLPSLAVRHDALGRPSLHWNAAVQAELDARQIQRCHLSLSDERYATLAFVVLET